LTYNRRREPAEHVRDEIRRAGGEASIWQLDLRDATAAAGVVADLLERFGSVHTLVHAAGLYVDQVHLSRVEPAKYQDHLVGEAAGFFNIVHPLLPALRETGGAVVAVTTIATRRY